MQKEQLAPILDKRHTVLISVGLEWWGNPRLCTRRARSLQSKQKNSPPDRSLASLRREQAFPIHYKTPAFEESKVHRKCCTRWRGPERSVNSGERG